MKNDEQHCEEHQDNIESPQIMPDADKPTDSNRKPLNQKHTYGNLINSEVMFQSNSALEKLKVAGRSMTPEGFIVG